MTIYLLDAEWNGDTADVVHCVVVKEFRGARKRYTFTDLSDFTEFCHTMDVTKWIIHAGMTADAPTINSVAKELLIDLKKVVDTFVVSRLVDYNKFSTHSLDELGEHLGVVKTKYEGGWDTCTPEMVEYCEQDVEVLEAIAEMLWPYITDPKWADAMRLEHDIASICHDMESNGFEFDTTLATNLLSSVKAEMDTLEDNFSKVFKSKLVEVKRLKMRYTKEGVPFKTVLTAMSEYPKTEVEGDELVVYDYKKFNPGSPKDRIDVLWDAGWEPFDKTKGHIAALREARR